MALEKQDPPLFRVGLGTDLHPLAPGGGLWIGGVLVPCPFRAEAESDGDVLLHALVDALLGGCGWGDIGEWFPGEAVERGEASARFVRVVAAKMREAGLDVLNVDAVVDVEHVRLAGWKRAIRENVAELLGIPASRVNIKAKTAEGLGPVGKGEAITAQAVALLVDGRSAAQGAGGE